MTTVQDAQLDLFTRDWTAWHGQQEARLADRHGFLAITALHWLSPQPQRFDDAPGAWSTGEGGVVVELDADDELTVTGVAVRGRYEFGPIPERGGVNAAWGDAVLEVARRGG